MDTEKTIADLEVEDNRVVISLPDHASAVQFAVALTSLFMENGDVIVKEDDEPVQ